MMIINKLEHHVNILNVREHERSLTARLLNKALRSLGGLVFIGLFLPLLPSQKKAVPLQSLLLDRMPGATSTRCDER